jgi:hypothetical protein
MRLSTPARARAGRRTLLPAGSVVLVALGCAAAAVVPATAAAVVSASADRAYELVSAADTGGLDVANRTGGQAVMAGADAALFATLGTAPGGQAGDLGFAPLLARRTAAGWREDTLAPALTPGVPRPTGLPNGSVVAAPRDLSSVLISTNQPMAAGVDTTVQNVFRRAFGPEGDGAASLVAGPASQFSYMVPQVVGVSADGRTALFQTPDQLTPDAPSVFTNNLYLARDGHVTLASRRPDGTAVPGGLSFGQPSHPSAHLLSEGGRTAFFVSGTDGKLYVNRDGAVVNASAPQGGADGTPTIWAASRDGSKLFFTDTGALTPDSSPTGKDAYSYDVATGALTPLAPSTVTGVAPPNMRYVAASANGDTVYFVAFAPLTPDTSIGVTRPLYAWHAGAIDYVGRIDPASVTTLADFSSVTDDGRFLVFPSAQDNTAQATGGTTQLYRYDSVAGTTTCVSCPPDGAPVDTAIEPYGNGYGIFATFPFTTPNSVTDDGDVVFTTAAALSPRDVNGKDDVYEWRAGEGVALVSGGTDPAGAQLGDVSRDGTDVFFTTRDALLRADDDDDADLYDARRGGGFPDEAPPKGAGDCVGDGCQGAPPVTAPLPSVATVTFAGPGDATPDASIPTLPRSAAVKATKGAVRAGRLTVTVRVPGAGRITASGPHVGTVRRTASKAGVYHLKVKLTAKARRSLKRHKKLKVSVKVGFTPSTEKPSNATLSLTVKA